ncbi:hypothetical protein BH18THE1_BH18THE1_09990 [soil metagenome]
MTIEQILQSEIKESQRWVAMPDGSLSDAPVIILAPMPL